MSEECGDGQNPSDHKDLDKSKGTFLYGECAGCGRMIQHHKWDKEKRGLIEV